MSWVVRLTKREEEQTSSSLLLKVLMIRMAVRGNTAVVRYPFDRIVIAYDEENNDDSTIGLQQLLRACCYYNACSK